MMSRRVINGWILIIILLVVIIAAGSVVIWTKSGSSHALEITLAPLTELRGEVYVSGEVSNPGIYPLQSGDSLEDIIRAAGGATDNADPKQIKLYIPGVIEGRQIQKVNINRAEVWLLEALPGIGEVRARAIVDYRQRNGPFRVLDELANVEGIGMATYGKIKDLITVTD
jgi:competence protein ComEA